MEIYIIRHTTPDVEKGICYGQTDLGLAENYLNEFKTIVKQISKNKTYKIISSPLKRCALLAKQFNDDIVFDDRLKELDFGDWEMKAWSDIPLEDINPWMEDFVNVAVPNGESYLDLASRVHDFFEELQRSQDNQNIIITTHAGPIRAYLATLLDIPLEKSFRIKVNYGDIFHLKKENNRLKLITPINP